MNGLIFVAREGPIVTVVLNRPEKLNALTKSMWRHLGETIATLSADDAVRCVIVRGAGEKAFSPGNDIGEFATERSNKAQAIEYGNAMHAAARALSECRHPIVAQIHGDCVGGGLEIAALCDLRICGESSRFGAPIKNLGLVMAYPEMAPLVRLVGAATALEILLEGRIFDAREALQKRLVTRVVPDAVTGPPRFTSDLAGDATVTLSLPPPVSRTVNEPTGVLWMLTVSSPWPVTSRMP